MARNNKKRTRNETPEENLARRTKKAEAYLQKVVEKQKIDLSQLSEEEYQEKLSEITERLTALGILR